MVARSLEQMMAECEKYEFVSRAVLTSIATNERSVDNHKSTEKVDRRTDAALLLTEPDMLYSTLFMGNPCDTTQITSSNTLLLI